LAPNDLRLNQRLAALHTRAGRFAEAALCCRTLQNVYSEAEHPDEATRYSELAERYEERTTAPAPRDSGEEAPIFLDAATPETAEAEPEVAEFAIEEAPAEVTIEEPEAAAAEEVQEPEEAAIEPASPWPTASPAVETSAEPEFAVVDESAAAAPAEAAATGEEIDLSSEWDDAITVEADDVPPVAVEEPVEVAETAPKKSAVSDVRVDETVEEIHFYVGHGMPEQALAALTKLQTLTHDRAKIDELRAEIDAAMQPAEEVAVEAEPVVEELTAEDVPSIEVAEEAPVVEEEPAPEPEPVVEEIPVVADTAVEPEPQPEHVHEPAPVAHAPEPEAQPAVLKEFVSDLESSLGETFLPGAVPHEPAPAPVAVAHAKTAAAGQPAPVLGEFVADIEASLGEDFLKAAPVAEPQPPTPVVAAKPLPAPIPVAPVETKRVSPLAASAAASASPAAPVASVAMHPVQTATVSAVPVASARTVPPVAPSAPVLPPTPPAPAAKSSPFGEDAGVDLADMFGELKKDLEADVASADEDPETHYNLGIAFREMGLLDEAIGELQKAVQSFDHGHPFPQIMQTYTWLAQCFLEKGVPEAAVRWYDKALKMPTIDGETRVALHYELAAAYETAGDKTSALKHFMDVYGSNIDYRDVAERIKALKS
jgi:hypothetical protein